MPVIRILLVWLFLEPAIASAGAAPIPDISIEVMESRYTMILDGCNQSKPCIEVKALQLYPKSTITSCHVRMERAALLLFDRDVDDPIVHSPLVELDGCDTNHASLRYNLGMLAWHRAQRREAEHHFIAGAQLLPEQQQAKWWTAAGAVAYESLAYDKAYSHFMTAFRADSVNVSPMLLSNLSALFLSWGRPDLTIAWGERALERFGQIPNDHNFGISKNFLELVHFNLFTAHVITGNRAGAEQSWQRIDLAALPAHPLQLAELLSMFARLINQPMLLELHGNKIRSRVLAFQDANPAFEVSYNEDPLVWLFTKEATPFVDAIGLVTAWEELSGMYPLLNASDEWEKSPANTEATGNAGSGWLWAWGGLLVMLPVPVWRHVQNRKNQPPTLQERLNAVHRDLASKQLTEDTKLNLKTAFASFQQATVATEEFKPPLEQINESERIVLRDAMNDVFPKETAQQNEWTPTYVYILRSSLRKKLNIPAHMTFEQWRNLNELEYQTAMNGAKRSTSTES